MGMLGQISWGFLPPPPCQAGQWEQSVYFCRSAEPSAFAAAAGCIGSVPLSATAGVGQTLGLGSGILLPPPLANKTVFPLQQSE